ncbi:MAG: hypothetical protein U9N87_02670 [Planctomycetota bacterium]|nr:hypothetical protein [Planctomycetota bacterium]
MAKELNVYRDWLGIKETARPLDNYKILRLARFEDDTNKIRSHYQKMNEHVRKFALGEHAARSQSLLNELAKAMLCLTDQQRKREYDAAMGRKTEGDTRRRTLEEILLANKVLDQTQLDKARNFAKAIGLDVRDAVLQQKLAEPDVVMLAYAEAIGLPYVELADIGVAIDLVAIVPPPTARQHSCLPVMSDEEQVLMASPNPLVPDVEEDLRLRFGKVVRTVLCTPSSINDLISKYYPRDAAAAPVAAAQASAPQAEPAAKEAKAKPAKKESAPLSPEDKQKLIQNTAILSFNITAMGWVVFRLATGGMSGLGTMDFIIAVVAGGIVAAIGVGVVSMKK